MTASEEQRREPMLPEVLQALTQTIPVQPSRNSRRIGSRLTIARGVAGFAAMALIAAAVISSGTARDGEKPSQDSQPLILKTAAVDAQGILDEVEGGHLAQHVLGTDPGLTEVRPISAFGGIAYVLTGAKGWCLVAPDDAINLNADPTRYGGLACQTLTDVERFGIALIVGHNAIAAIPQGVPGPTLSAPDGSVHRLELSAQGVVTVEDAPSGAALTLYSTDGRTRALHFP